MMSQILLALFPVLLLGILLFGVKVEAKGQIRETFWDLTDAKNLQAVAAFFIVLHHLTQSITDYGRIDKGPITGLNSVGILFTSIFFFFSGYGLYSSLHTKEDYLSHFFRNRVMKVLIPFVLTNWIYAILMASFYQRISSIFDFCTSLLGFTLMNTNAWFVVEILLYYIVFYFAFKKCKNERNAMSVMWSVSVLIMLVGLLAGHDRTRVNGHWFMGEWWYNTTFMFPLGLTIAKNKSRVSSFLKQKFAIRFYVTFAVFILAYFVSEYIIDRGGYYFEGWYGLFHSMLSLLGQMILCSLFLILILMVNMKCCFDNDLLRLMGSISLEIYLIHGAFSDYLSREFYKSDDIYFLFVIGYSILGAMLLHVAIATIYDCYKIWLEEYRFIKENGYKAYTYEKMKRVKRFMWGVRLVIVLLITICVSTVVSGVYEAYQFYVVDKNYFENEMQLLTDARQGDTVSFGGFNINTETREREAVTWYVAKRENNRLLLVCDYAIAYYFNQKKVGVTYENANVVQVLNEGIYYTLFDSYEKPYILGEQENTKLFLLSADEVNTYLDSEHMRVKKIAVLDSRVYFASEKDKYLWWWLSDTTPKEQKAWVVTRDGEIDMQGRLVNNASGGVRPAMWITVNDAEKTDQ